MEYFFSEDIGVLTSSVLFSFEIGNVLLSADWPKIDFRKGHIIDLKLTFDKNVSNAWMRKGLKEGLLMLGRLITKTVATGYRSEKKHTHLSR